MPYPALVPTILLRGMCSRQPCDQKCLYFSDSWPFCRCGSHQASSRPPRCVQCHAAGTGSPGLRMQSAFIFPILLRHTPIRCVTEYISMVLTRQLGPSLPWVLLPGYAPSTFVQVGSVYACCLCPSLSCAS